MRPRLLDLFCCGGGAGAGYRRAGFDVTGVDVDRHHYPAGEFLQADVLEVLARPDYLAGFDAIHASPPCQDYLAITMGTNAGRRYPRLVEPVRAALHATGLPYVIECGTGPHLRADLTLCGEMFGLKVIRHRDFECGRWTAQRLLHVKHRGRVKGWRHGVNHEGYYFAVYGKGGGKGTVDEWRDAMGIDWTRDEFELREALPPAYTEFVGRQLIAHIGALAA